ncbi:MAG: isoprenylcysteine carboxylmethyltransferase family protein [Planifilum fimeticola]
MGIGWALILVVVAQRLAELRIARRNARWAREQGGYEVGGRHYPLIVSIHLLWFLGMAGEILLGATPPVWWPVPATLFLLAQFLRYWCLRSLGRHWNTRIWVIPGRKPVIRGPYRYIRHPNYLAVIAEILTLPLALGAFWTAAAVSLLNLLVLLRVRIPAEERALAAATGSDGEMGGKSRLIPFPKRG